MEKSTVALSRLLQLASPMLPVGAYSYSQGLEWAIEDGIVNDQASTARWIADAMQATQARFELPVLLRLFRAWEAEDWQGVEEWDSFYLAGRDTAEALAETQQMGYSLQRLLNELEIHPAEVATRLRGIEKPGFPTVYAAVAVHWGLAAEEAMHAYLWGWLENQTSAAMKTVPLGQAAGQRIMLALGETIPKIVAGALALDDRDISNFAPLLSIAGCKHETQYTRLFRS